MRQTWRLWLVGGIVVAVAAVIVLVNYLDGQKIVPEKPGVAVNYTLAGGGDTYIAAGVTGYHWQYYDEKNGKRAWASLGPNGFFSDGDNVKKIQTSGETIFLELSGGVEEPDETILMRWPETDWTPGNPEAAHGEGTAVDIQWSLVGNFLQSSAFAVEDGNLYALWLHFGDAWVEYSFLVNPGSGEWMETLTSPGHWTGYASDFPGYQFTGVMEAEYDDRHFMLEDKPANEAEALVVNHYYFDIAGKYDELAGLYGSEPMQISAVSMRENFEEGNYIQEYLLHDLKTLTVAEFTAMDPYILEFADNMVVQESLTAYACVRAAFTMHFSPGMQAMGPQLSEGDYNFYYLCGAGENGVWKIYDVYWE